ncbi:MAG: hypothetical protein NVV59_00120 [Chitinophagaceae bacterium]|nr:hypothetical protein [Chitinophagaceae bacterium]
MFWQKSDIRKGQAYIVMSANYWRYDTCLYSKKMCKYNTSIGINAKVYSNSETVICELLQGNNSGYQSKNPYDTFKYSFVPENINKSQLVRNLLIKDKYIRTDTFNLTVVDTLLFYNYSLIKKVFGKSETVNQKLLKIYVLKSVDGIGSVMLHYWVERIGIIKLTDEKCWRYSFEIKDDRTKPIKKMFAELTKIIKEKYKDPYWLSEPCSIE